MEVGEGRGRSFDKAPVVSPTLIATTAPDRALRSDKEFPQENEPTTEGRCFMAERSFPREDAGGKVANQRCNKTPGHTCALRTGHLGLCQWSQTTAFY